MPTSTAKRIVVIPARMASNRLPGKPLRDVCGAPLIRWTYDRARQTSADHVLVATPDREIGRYCQDNGMLWRPTNPDHPTGTHRVEEVIRQFRDGVEVGVVVNWQCDEPLVSVRAVDMLMDVMSGGGDGVGTLAAGIRGDDLHDRNVAKVVASQGRAMWFSRAPMGGSLGHVGVYAFRPRVLSRLAMLEPTPLSRAESLEQLAWLEAGFRIGVIETAEFPLGVNTEEDVARLVDWTKHHAEGNHAAN